MFKTCEEISTTERMRQTLKPRGSANMTRLHMDNNFVNYDFVLKCIDELEKMPFKVALGDRPSNLERLACMLLMDSAYISNSALPTES